MRRKFSASNFFIFLLFCIFILGISKLGFSRGLTSQVNAITSFLGRNFHSLFTNNFSDLKIVELQKQNEELFKKLKDYQVLQRENNALKDQFQNTSSYALNLLPATIIGFPSETYILDKGERDGVKAGQAVIINDMVVGKVVKTSSTISMVNLIFHTFFSTTAKDLETKAQGVINGAGSGELLLDNVLLSERLNVRDTIVTKGDMNIDNIGFPSDLIMGKIVSIDKKPSAIFQTAKVKSSIDFQRLSTVFVVLGIK